MKIELEIIEEDHTRVVLRNAKGDTLTYNPFHQMGLEELIQGAKLASDGVSADVSERTCANCHFCVPNVRPTARHDMNLCTKEKYPVSLTMPPDQYVCDKWCVR